MPRAVVERRIAASAGALERERSGIVAKSCATRAWVGHAPASAGGVALAGPGECAAVGPEKPPFDSRVPSHPPGRKARERARKNAHAD